MIVVIKDILWYLLILNLRIINSMLIMCFVTNVFFELPANQPNWEIPSFNMRARKKILKHIS